MGRKKSERHGGDEARKEPRAPAEENEEVQAGGTEDGARRETAAGQATDATAQLPSDTAATETKEEALRRAEQLVDEWGARLGQVAAQAGQQVRRLAARARKEAEDIWAEAQSISRGEGGQISGAESSGDAPRAVHPPGQEFGARLGRVAHGLGQQLRQLAARAREEAQAIWADAQDIRHRQAASQPTPEEPPHAE